MPVLISIVIPTYNNGKEVDRFFASLSGQTFNGISLEIIAVDGGSTDNTKKVLKKHKAKIYFNKYVLAEPGVSIGIKNAKGNLIMILAMDNFFHDPDSLKKIVGVFRNKSVYAAFPKQNYDPYDNLFTRYHNTFTDPFNHFVQGDSANARTFHRVYNTLEHNNLYDIYDYNSSNEVPMISFSQGFTVRGSYQKVRRDIFDDNRPVIQIIKENKKIAYIHSVSVYHHTIRDLKHFIKKQRWATRNALEKKNYGIAHRFTMMSPGQKWRIRLWPFYAFSIIFPLIDTLKGLIRDRDYIWLFHPINCLLCAYANTVELLVFLTGKIGLKLKDISRQ